MTLTRLMHHAQKMLTDSSPAILTAIGVAGTFTTAYLAGKASYRAANVLRMDQLKHNLSGEPEKELDLKDSMLRVWKLYIPAASSAVLTVSAIVCANRVGMRRAAAMAAAYSLSEKTLGEYKEKVLEKFGENKEREVRDEIAQAKVDRSYEGSSAIVVGTGEVLCHDAYSGRFFSSSVETIRKAQNDINHQLTTEDSATLSDFYDLIDLDHISISDEFGWNSAEPLELDWTTCKTPDNRPAMSFEFKSRPILKPWASPSFR